MARPPRRPAAKQPANPMDKVQIGALGVGESGADDVESTRGTDGFDPNKAAAELMDLVSEAIRGDASIPDADQEAFSESFAAALREVVDSGSFARTNPIEMLQDSIEQLKQLAAQADEDVAIVRQVNDALAPLEARRTRIAIEFGERLERDGRESALSWYRQQHDDAAEDSQRANKVASQMDGDPVRPLRDEVTQSRSRRLRGPPGRR